MCRSLRVILATLFPIQHHVDDRYGTSQRISVHAPAREHAHEPAACRQYHKSREDDETMFEIAVQTAV